MFHGSSGSAGRNSSNPTSSDDRAAMPVSEVEVPWLIFQYDWGDLGERELAESLGLTVDQLRALDVREDGE